MTESHLSYWKRLCDIIINGENPRERLGETPWKMDNSAMMGWEADHGHDPRIECTSNASNCALRLWAAEELASIGAPLLIEVAEAAKAANVSGAIATKRSCDEVHWSADVYHPAGHNNEDGVRLISALAAMEGDG